MQKENFDNLFNTIDLFINKIEIEPDKKNYLRAINSVSNYSETSIMAISTFLEALKSSLNEEKYDYNSSNLYEFMQYINNKVNESLVITKQLGIKTFSNYSSNEIEEILHKSVNFFNSFMVERSFRQ